MEYKILMQNSRWFPGFQGFQGSLDTLSPNNIKVCRNEYLRYSSWIYILSKKYRELVNKIQTIYYSSKFILPPSK